MYTNTMTITSVDIDDDGDNDDNNNDDTFINRQHSWRHEVLLAPPSDCRQSVVILQAAEKSVCDKKFLHPDPDTPKI